METKEIELEHHGDGTVRFRADELRDDQRLRLSFREGKNRPKSARSFLSRALLVNPVVIDIYRSGFLQNGSVGLFGTIGSHEGSSEGFDFAATIQVDGDIVCKINRRALSEPDLAGRLRGFGRLQALFVEELQQVAAQFKNRVLGSGSVGLIGSALYLYFEVIRPLFP